MIFVNLELQLRYSNLISLILNAVKRILQVKLQLGCSSLICGLRIYLIFVLAFFYLIFVLTSIIF